MMHTSIALDWLKTQVQMSLRAQPQRLHNFTDHPVCQCRLLGPFDTEADIMVALWATLEYVAV